jgi:hypothetical protein
MATTTEERNKELMQTLDDAWNAQDVDVFRQRHKPDVIPDGGSMALRVRPSSTPRLLPFPAAPAPE